MKLLSDLNVTELLNVLQQLTKQNADKIGQNNEEANKIPAINSDIFTKTKLKSVLYKENSELTKENNKFIQLHVQLMNFLKNYSESIEIVSETNEIQPDITPEPTTHSTNTLPCNQSTETKVLVNQKKSTTNKLQNLEEKMRNKIATEEYEECHIIQQKINQLKKQ